MLDCPFRLSYILDDKTNDYMINSKKSHFDHNHELDYEGISKRKAVKITKFMEKREMEEHLNPKDIKKESEAYLEGHLNCDQVEIPYKQSAYLFSKTKKKIWGPSDKDANLLNEFAEEVKKEFPNCLAEVQIDENNRLKNFVYSSEQMRELYLRFNDVLLMDTTFKTNKFKMSLLIIAGINEEGKTVLLGFAALRSEEAINMGWAYKKIIEYFGKQPVIINTDSCPTLSKIIKDTSPETTHLLCGWHVSQNIKKHISGMSKSLQYYL